MSTTKLSLDPEKRSNQTMEFQASLRSKIVGQEEGVQALVDLYQVFCAGLNSPGDRWGTCCSLGRRVPARLALWKRRRRSYSATHAR